MKMQLIQWHLPEFDQFYVSDPTHTENLQGEEVLRNNSFFLYIQQQKGKSAEVVRWGVWGFWANEPLHCETKSNIQKNISSATRGLIQSNTMLTRLYDAGIDK